MVQGMAKFCIIVISVVITMMYYFFIVKLLSKLQEPTDNKLKLEIVERLIYSNDNQESCRIPQMDIYSPEMMKFVKDNEPLDCGTDEDWVSCTKSLCFVRNSIIIKLGTITCDFTDILRSGDYSYKYGEPVRSSTMYILKESDFAKAECWTVNYESKWSGIIYGIRKTLKRDHIYEQRNPERINVLMYGFDSLSKNAFIRKLPHSYEFLTNKLRGDVLQGYNIVGDGTPQALIPILTGFTELELPETRKRMKDSKSVCVYPMIWSEYERSGYVTSFNEDLPDYGTFTYRLNGFDEQPTNHYMRTYYLAISPEQSKYKKMCVGQKARHNVMLDYTKQFMEKYTATPRFAFSFHGELSHDSINLIGVADMDIQNWLADLQANGVLNSTILVLMSDHGNRFATIRDTLQGKLEERLPFFSFVFPEWFKIKYHQQYENFKDNLHALTTPFDVHATLKHILRLSTPFNKIKKITTNSRAISLFDKIPKSRSCADAYIEPHWCACMNWHQINDTQNEYVVRAAQSVVEKINDFTKKDEEKCSRLYLRDIKWAGKLVPHDNLIRFKQNSDLDGYLADMSSTTKISTEMYQVKIVVLPGNSIFEASLLYDLKQNNFRVKLSDVSRVNKYGSQAQCILDSDPELRKYCYCKM